MKFSEYIKSIKTQDIQNKLDSLKVVFECLDFDEYKIEELTEYCKPLFANDYEPSEQVALLFMLSGFEIWDSYSGVKGNRIKEVTEFDIDESFYDFEYTDWKVDYDDCKVSFQTLIYGAELDIDLDDYLDVLLEEDDYENIHDMSDIVDIILNDYGYTVAFFNDNWDSYCFTIVKTEKAELLRDTFNELFKDSNMSCSVKRIETFDSDEE